MQGRRPGNNLAMPWADQQENPQALQEAHQHPGAAADRRLEIPFNGAHGLLQSRECRPKAVQAKGFQL